MTICHHLLLILSITQNVIGAAAGASSGDWRKMCAIYRCSKCMGKAVSGRKTASKNRRRRKEPKRFGESILDLFHHMDDPMTPVEREPSPSAQPPAEEVAGNDEEIQNPSPQTASGPMTESPDNADNFPKSMPLSEDEGSFDKDAWAWNNKNGNSYADSYGMPPTIEQPENDRRFGAIPETQGDLAEWIREAGGNLESEVEHGSDQNA